MGIGIGTGLGLGWKGWGVGSGITTLDNKARRPSKAGVKQGGDGRAGGGIGHAYLSLVWPSKAGVKRDYSGSFFHEIKS